MPTKNEMEGLCAAGDAAALERIAATAPKAEAKEARRALHRLAAKGVKLPEARPAGESVYHAAREEFAPECFLSAFDAGGGQVAFVFRKNPAGGVQGTIVYMDEEQGILEAQRTTLGRREYRAWIEELLRGARGIIAQRAAPDDVKHALRDARARTDAHGRILPPAAAEIAPAWFTPARDRREEPAADPALAADSARLFLEPEVAHWVPPQEFLQALVHRVQEAETSQLLVDEAQKARRVDEILHGAIDEYFTADRRRAYARRLRGTAVLFDTGGRGAQAATARAAAAWLDDPSAALAGLGFARVFILRVFAAMPAEGGDPASDRVPDRTHPPPPAGDPAARLIVTPGEFAQEMAKRKP